MAGIQMFPLGPPAVDTYSMLSNLGQTFFKSVDDARKRKLEDEADQINRDQAKALLGTPDTSAQPAQPSNTIANVGQNPVQQTPTPTPRPPSFSQTGGQMRGVNTSGWVPEVATLVDEFQKTFPEVRITSGYRDPTYNAKVGGARGSQHVHGKAFDFSVRGLPEERQIEIANWLRSKGARGFGYYPNSQSMHADLGEARFWGPSYSRDSLGQTPQWFQRLAGMPNPVAPPSGPPPVSGRSMVAYAGVPSQRPVQVASASPGMGFSPDTPSPVPAYAPASANPGFSPMTPAMTGVTRAYGQQYGQTPPAMPQAGPQSTPFDQAVPGASVLASLGGVNGTPTMPLPSFVNPTPAPAPPVAPQAAATPPQAPAPVQLAQAAPASPVASDANPIATVLRRLPPAQQAWYVRALSNRLTAPAAMQQLQAMVRQDKWTTTTAPDGRLIQTNERGEIRPVQGYDKPQDRWTYQDAPNGDLIGTNAATGKKEVLNAGERDAVLRQYDRAKREGFVGGIFDFKKSLAEAGASRTNINTNPGPAAAVYKSAEERADQARSAAAALPSFSEAKRLLDSGQIILGAGADMRLGMAKIGALFGLDGESAANTETFRSTVAPTVLALVKGLGAGSGISNADREFAEKAAGGNINLEPAAIKRLMEIGVKAAQAKVKQHNALIDKIYPESDPQNAQVRALFKVDVPEDYPAPEPAKPAPSPARPNPTQQPAATERRTVPPGAARELRSGPDTPERRRMFDEVFGPGAADEVLKGRR